MTFIVAPDDSNGCVAQAAEAVYTLCRLKNSSCRAPVGRGSLGLKDDVMVSRGPPGKGCDQCRGCDDREHDRPSSPGVSGSTNSFEEIAHGAESLCAIRRHSADDDGYQGVGRVGA